MTGAFRIFVLCLVASYGVAATRLCPPATEAPRAARSSVADPSHETSATSHDRVGMPCHEDPTPLALRAPCPCGCAEHAAPPGTPMGLGPALVSRTAGPAFARAGGSLPARPDAPADAAPLGIDHVPLIA